MKKFQVSYSNESRIKICGLTLICNENNGFCFYFLRTVSTTSGSASTSDSAIDSRLRVLDDNSREQGTSYVPHDVPSIPDHSRSDEAVEEEDEKSTGNGTDIHEDGDNERMNGASDHDDFENESEGDIVRGATQNGHVVGLKDRNTVQNESSDDMSDRDSKKRKSPDREEQFEIRTKGDVMPDISTKKRKTKRASEVSCDRYL